MIFAFFFFNSCADEVLEPEKEYIVSFDTGRGSSGIPLQIVANGYLAEKPKNPIRPGFTFSNWYKDSDRTQIFDFATDTISQDITLYAEWSTAAYTVNFDADGGSSVSQQTVVWGRRATQPANPTRANSIFVNWYIDSNRTQIFDFTTDAIYQDTTLYANWIMTYTVDFQTDGGSSVPSQTVARGQRATQPANPTRSNFVFANWHKDSDKTQIFDFTTDAIYQDTTLYANWIMTYTVDFQTDGGSSVPSQTVARGQRATQPANPTRLGFIFANWYKDNSKTQIFDFATDTISQDITIYAKWSTVAYTVSFDTDGGSSVPQQTVVHGQRATQPVNPTRSNFAFVNWYKDSSKTQIFDFATEIITQDTTLYAKWIMTYSVNFDTRDTTNSFVPSQTVALGQRATRPPDPISTSFIPIIFVDWYKDTERTQIFDFATETISQNITIYAEWRIADYTVSFDTGGGNSVSQQTVRWGQRATRPANPTRANSIFVNWYIDSNRTQIFDFNQTVRSNTTIYAGWFSKLQANDRASGDNFGHSVSVDGNTIIVGAPEEDTGGGNAGAAYIFTRSGTRWSQQAKLQASDKASGDNFGYSVAIDGNTVIVGAPEEDTGGSDAGAAYIFTRSGTRWSQQAKLQASDKASGDNFGYSVAIDGSRIIVGAPEEDTGGSGAGAAYIFTRIGTGTSTRWNQDTKIQASDKASGDNFGEAVAIAERTVVVGAYLRGNGAAYIFNYAWFSWSQQAKLLASDGEWKDYFGGAVAIDGNTVIVGAAGEDTGGGGAGAAYIFTRSGTSWSQQAKIQASDRRSRNGFGYSVSVDGNTIIVGAPRDQGDGGGNASDAGAAYIFTRSGTRWSQQIKLQADDRDNDDDFGTSVSIDGNTVIIGAPGENTGGRKAGSAYPFAKNSSGNWVDD